MVNLFKWLKGVLLGVFGAFLREVFDVAKVLIVAELKDFAYSIVKELSFSTISNTEKRRIAVDHLIAEAKRRGIVLRESLAALIVEMAVTKMKNLLEGR